MRGSAGTRLWGMTIQIPPGAMDVYCLFVCCQVEVSAMGRSLVQRSLIKCGVSECDLETSTMWQHWPTGTVEPLKKKVQNPC